jgi:flagellar biosynthetic protein FliQ
VVAPFLAAALIVGVGVALIQTATQIQDSALAFVPKILAAIAVLGLCGHMLLDRLGSYTKTAFETAAQTQASRP